MNSQFDINLSRELIEYFAPCRIPFWQRGNALEEYPTVIQDQIKMLIKAIPENVLKEYITHPVWSKIYDDDIVDGDFEKVKELIISHRISNEIVLYRNNILLGKSTGMRRRPYNHPSINKIDIHEFELVRLTDFNIDNQIIERNGYIFDIIPITQAANSSYWLRNTLLSVCNDFDIQIRLDPLIVIRKDDYRDFGYKARVYGTELDWDEILGLKTEIHGRWFDDRILNIRSQFTDIVWTPRGEEIHFKCEEVPLPEESHLRGGRYFHSILNPMTKCFIHIDGAIRFYSDKELKLRKDHHVRNVGKIGKRVKVFKIDGEVPISIWAELVNSFFFWNMDVMDYISMGKNFPKEN